MKTLRRALLVSTLLAAASALSYAQQPAVIRTETRLVEVDVAVSDKKGNHIADLQAKDFHVWEDNHEQAITTFQPQPDPAQDRFFVIFFDAPHFSPGILVQARNAAIQFVQGIAGPKRQIAIAIFDNSLRIAQNFTPSPAKLTEVLNSISLSGAGQPAPPPPRGGRGIVTEDSTSELFVSLSHLAKDLGSLPGKKTLIWFGGALTASGDTELNSLLTAFNRSNTSVYPMDLQPGPGGGADGQGGADTGGPGQPQAGSRNRGANPRMQSADVSLAAAGANNSVLSMIAQRTGGFPIKELLTGLNRVAAEQEELYVLGYTPPPSAEGACHAIKVKVDRAGVNLRARDGYCNARPADLLAGSSVEKELENRAAGAKPGNLTAELQLPFFYTPTGAARVNAAMEIPLANVKFEKQNGKLRLVFHVLGSALDPHGNVSARFSDTVNLDFNDQASADRFASKPYHYENQFDIAPGQYAMEVVFSAGRDSFGKLMTPLSIDSWQPNQFALSALALSSQFKEASKSDLLFADARHLIANEVQVIPSGSLRFSKLQAVSVYFEIYDPQPSVRLAVQIKIIERNSGAVKFDSGPQHVNSASLVNVAMKVPVDNLPAGLYLLEVSSTDNSAQTAKRSADFEIQ